MLEKILIKNYLLLKDIEINFGEGFNIITGETGAGKSILINAMSLLLGERADYSIINKNKEKMVIEGWMKKTKTNRGVIENQLKWIPAPTESGFSTFAGIDIKESFDDYIIIRRELYSKGYSRNFINDSPVNINDLKMLGDSLVDIHSQNEHQSLLNKSVHIELLDSFTSKESKNFSSLLQNYQTGFEKLHSLDTDLESFNKKKTELESKRTFIEFQLKEINEVSPNPGEDEELEKELKMSENTEFIQQVLNTALTNLYDDTGSVTERLKIVEKELEKIKDINTEISDILKEVTVSSAALNEASRQIQNISNNLTFDPAKIESIRERLFKLQFIKKKYGSNIESIIKLKDELESDLSLLENFDNKLAGIQKETEGLKTKLFKQAEEISVIRKQRSKILEKEIVMVLKDVGFEFSEFKVGIEVLTGTDGRNNFTIKQKSSLTKLGGNGIDDVEFLVKINKGDEFSSLRKTASGGEISRIMLAVKTVLADADKIDVLIFDEIDSGVSGRIAQKVGRVLKKLSGYHQVISITHLAQIAALAEDHFLVEKEVDKDKTYTKIRKLDKNERVIEVAKLLSGEKVTDASIKSAKELISS
jgi:DNA repair protein RecN (Recombination protein N)